MHPFIITRYTTFPCVTTNPHRFSSHFLLLRLQPFVFSLSSSLFNIYLHVRGPLQILEFAYKKICIIYVIDHPQMRVYSQNTVLPCTDILWSIVQCLVLLINHCQRHSENNLSECFILTLLLVSETMDVGDKAEFPGTNIFVSKQRSCSYIREF